MSSEEREQFDAILFQPPAGGRATAETLQAVAQSEMAMFRGLQQVLK